MSLLNEKMTECVKLEKTQIRDGYGGNNSLYIQSKNTFYAAITLYTDNKVTVAEKENLATNYYLYTKKSVGLKFNDYIMRLKDEKCFRIITDSADRQTPNSAYLNIERVEAEEVNIKVVAANVTK